MPQERGVFAIEPIEDLHFVCAQTALIRAFSHAARLLPRLAKEPTALRQRQVPGIAVDHNRLRLLAQRPGSYCDHVVVIWRMDAARQECGQGDDEQQRSFHKQQED